MISFYHTADADLELPLLILKTEQLKYTLTPVPIGMPMILLSNGTRQSGWVATFDFKSFARNYHQLYAMLADRGLFQLCR